MPYLPTASRNAMADALVDLIDGGTGAGTIQIRSGSRPSSANDAATGTLLATLTFTDPAFGAAATGTATASSITSDTSADNTGTATWARILDSDDNTIMDCSVGTSGAEINLDSVSITAGGTVAVSSFTVTMPDGTS